MLRLDTLRKFDASAFMPDGAGVALIIGKRATGKSVLVKDLLSRHRDIPFGTVVSPTESGRNYGCIRIPALQPLKQLKPLQVREDYDRDVVVRVLDRQEAMHPTRCIRRDASDAFDASADPRAFLVLDDCMFDTHWHKDPAVRQLFSNVKSYRTLVFLTLPYPYGLPAAMRDALHYVFILRESHEGNRRRLYSLYGAYVFDTFEGFCLAMDRYCTDFGCLVLDYTARSNRPEEIVFWYRAEQPRVVATDTPPIASRL